ncbi:MAG: DUF2490 domain-containing protein [Flavobacteriaceae bacterium]
MTKNKTTLLHFLFLVLTTFHVYAQQPGEGDLGGWYMYFGTNKVSEKFSIHTEAQFRYWETASNFNQLLLRTGINYHINPNAIATIGYGHITTDGTFTEPENEVNSKEHRIFEQFILKNKVWELGFEHRYRLEQRFLDFGDTTDTQHRARYRLQVTLPLTQTFFLNFYDELFINLQDNLFGQNRLYGALGMHITENSSLQLGFMRNQFSSAVYNRLQVGFIFNPDLRKKKASTN